MIENENKFECLRNSEGIKAANSSVYVCPEDWTDWAEEISKCQDDIIYFAENYFTIIGERGKEIITLYEKQKELIQCFVDNQKTICVASRQIGKTTCYTILALHVCLFNDDKQVLIVANKESSAIEFLGRIRLAYQLLPDFLKIGCKEFNKKKVVFENDSSIEISATSPDSARGKTGSCVTGDTLVITNIKDTLVQVPISYFEHYYSLEETLPNF